MVQGLIRFPKFTEIVEITEFTESSAPFWKNSIDVHHQFDNRRLN